MKIPLTPFIPLVTWLYRLWCFTLRISQDGREALNELAAQKQGAIICLWHCEIFGIIAVREKLKFGALVSPSQDGSFLAGILRRLGLVIVAGSSSRGGAAAMKKLLPLVQNEGLLACITPDGPRGPALKVKNGIVFLAQHSGAPIIPVRMFAQRAKRFSSWDRFILPLPFSRVHIRIGEPYHIAEPAGNTEETVQTGQPDPAAQPVTATQTGQPVQTGQPEIEQQCRILEEKMRQLAEKPLPFTNYV